MYVNQVHSLKPGRLRYGLMLSEHGVIYDDGVIARLANDHFLVGTTSGHAAAIADQFDEWLQCEWPLLRVVTENVTTCWAVFNVAGPRARDTLATLELDIDLSPSAFPHMTCRDTRIGGVSCRIQRVSFSGELSYEISVPWGYGQSLWDALVRAGQPFGILPFGVESLMTLRIEKGFLHVGADTDATTLPQDIGFAQMIARKPGDFVGRRSTMCLEALRDDRRQFVGLDVIDGGDSLEVGAHILPAGQTPPGGTAGWVTSAVWSPTLDRPVALALIEHGHARMGDDVRVWNMGATRIARICDPHFYDPSGARLND